MTTPTFPGVSFTLGTKSFVVPPLSLGAIEEFEERINKFDEQPTIVQIRLTVDLAHRALRRNYPDLERAELAELVDMRSAYQLFAAIMGISGLELVDPATVGKAPAPASDGTGSPSTPISPPVSAGPSSTAEST